MPFPQLLIKQKWATAGSCVVFYGYLLSLNNSAVSPTRRDFCQKRQMKRFPLLNLQDHCEVNSPAHRSPEPFWSSWEGPCSVKHVGEFHINSDRSLNCAPLVGSDLTREIYHNLWLSVVCPWKWNANNAIKNNTESACDNVHNDYGILDPHNFRCHCTERACIDFRGLM